MTTIALLKLAHLAAAIVWLGGMAFMLFALRPSVGTLPPPQRLNLVLATLSRFFSIVWGAIAVLLASGLAMLLLHGMKNAPLGWHLMLTIGLVMFALFAHLYFAPYRRLQRAVAQSDWPAGAEQVKAIARLAMVNFVLGWVAIGAVRLVA
jgi:uncharacterized membrane protein